MRLLALSCLLLAACSHGSRVEPGEPHAGNTREVRPDAATPVIAPTPPGPGPDPSAVTPAAPPSKIKIVIRSTPRTAVSWGRKQLGVTPVTLERPRDSGPVDLVLRASGYFPLHTRAYTVKNDVIGVRLTKVTDRMTLFGAKQEIPPDDAPGDATLDPNKALAPPAPTPAP